MRKKAHRYTRDDYIFVYQMLLLRSQGYSFPQIGLMFNKDHSTIIYWCKKFNVDIGKPVPHIEEFEWKIFKKPKRQEHKYSYILDERINRGKLRYQDYLREDQSKKSISFSS